MTGPRGEILVAVMTPGPCLNFDVPASINGLVPLFLPPSDKTEEDSSLVAFQLEASSVSLNDGGKRHFTLLTSRLRHGSLLGSSGQTAHLLIEGPFLGSDSADGFLWRS